MQVSVRDYHLSHSAAEGRALPIETFHAKVVVADDTLAYVDRPICSLKRRVVA
jgi:hypothetical protein